MNLPIQRKQTILLALSLGLAIASYWIPLPPDSQVRNSARTETATQYAQVNTKNSLATR
ncbi:exported hypothetical protein [Candidatus Contendobacter odensis Run_B_J11]|uniref:Uncharacterized protein n=1 Tax=Candidatus Contendobacter odensis Run_B_J11 TaxID=1400861 RepID=A0A7U7GFP0_9GAMM|nr:exported hypothetical protein [Candidatus Contendobacter odensis Run_B_J11]